MIKYRTYSPTKTIGVGSFKNSYDHNLKNLSTGGGCMLCLQNDRGHDGEVTKGRGHEKTDCQ